MGAGRGAGRRAQGCERRLTRRRWRRSPSRRWASCPSARASCCADVPIIVAELPAEADVDGGLDPRALGLFSGDGLPGQVPPGRAAGADADPPLPRNLERWSARDDELREEIRMTLLHETGHFFGLDEAELGEVGLA